jgi:hypothetical protein
MPDDRTRELLAEGRPSRQTSVLVGLAMLVALVFVIFLRKPPKIAAPPPTAPPAPVYTTNPADQLSSAMAELEKLPLGEGPPLSKLHEALEGVGASDKGYQLPDGKFPPPLAADAPRVVRIGVVLVRYQGAQLAPIDAPSRDASLVRAKQLAELAKTDFAAAVKAGDQGSAVDIGAVHRGILEPGTQYVVFTTPPGSVTEVLDTPRGFWIVRRIR